ncbi:MAG: hypothetical protein JJU45_05480 [Acidimicrobiia bacterium]|nr:hypothetical protein [Acidimicrobiia bacterium]
MRVTFRSRVVRATLAVAVSLVIAAGVAGLPTTDPVPTTPTITTPATPAEAEESGS